MNSLIIRGNIIMCDTHIHIQSILQRFRQILKELIWNLHYTDVDQKSETIVYSYQVMEKILI